MTIAISPETEKRLRDRAEAEGVSVEAYIELLIREREDGCQLSETPIAPDHPEFGEVSAAVREGLEQAKRGESRPAQDVFADLRAKHGVLR